MREGLIPAHAGKTVERKPSWFCSMAHPRSRGENVTEPKEPVVGSGSSPLTRGKRSAPDECVVEDGLIPAHAGKTARAASPG